MIAKKPLLIATLTAAVAMAAVTTKAQAADPVLGALIGGGIGAAIGHDVNRHNGAAVGGVLGAIVGSSIASSSGYYDRDYYNGGYATNYYAPGYYSPGYYAAPAPVYSYAPVYPSYGVSYVYRDTPRYRGHYYTRHDGRYDRRDGRWHR